MVATVTTYGSVTSMEPVHSTSGESDEMQIELSDLGRPPGTCRGVHPNASDWFSCLERRRAGSYLPV